MAGLRRAADTLDAVTDELPVVTVTYSPGPHLERFLSSLSVATDRPVDVVMADNGSVDGDVTAPRVAIAEGAHFRGAIDMQRTGHAPAKPAAAAPAPAKAGA